MQWCATVERAKEEVKAGTTVTSLDTPRSEETPGGDKTPVELHSPPIPAGIAAIPIPLSVATSTAQVGGISESYNTSTTSTSPLTPFSPSAPSLLSSSYTTTSTAPTNAPAAPRVPPNSYAAGFTTAGAGSLGLQSSEGAALELDSLTAGLEQVVRTASFSSAGGASSVTDPEGGYFAHPPRLVLGATTGSPSRNPPPSPGGVVSSSEDDDGFDTAEPWISALPPVLHPSFPHEDRVVEQPTGFGDPNKVILAGYLMKQGKRKTWRKRWFVLMSGRLVYSRSHMVRQLSQRCRARLTSIVDRIRKFIDKFPFSKFSTRSNTLPPPQSLRIVDHSPPADRRAILVRSLRRAQLSTKESGITSTRSRSSPRSERISSVRRARRTRSNGSLRCSASSLANRPLFRLPLRRPSPRSPSSPLLSTTQR